MPLSSKNIGLKLGKSGKGTVTAASDALETLKLQHAEELAAANEEHARKVESLEGEVERCRAEIDALTRISDEHSDTLMPLPSPSKTLKFVRNTSGGRKARKGAGGKSDKMIVGMKMQHRKDLARAAEIYAKKLHSMKKEVERYKAETEAVKASATLLSIRSVDEQKGCDDSGVNLKTGVAENDKENATHKRSPQRTSHSKDQAKPRGKLATSSDKTLQPQNGTEARESLDLPDHLKDQYRRLFLDEYQLEKDPAWEEAVATPICVGNDAINNEEIDAMCKGLIDFMADVRATSLR